MNAEAKEAWDYLQEVVADYERYVSDIGNLGLAAPNLLYYRTDIQDILDAIKGEKGVDFRSVWLKVRELDEVVRNRAQDIVDEVGHANFKQYQIINDPPLAHWWWYLNRVTRTPPPPPKPWELWRQIPLLFEENSEEHHSGGEEHHGGDGDHLQQ